ncbi:gag-polypeptide of LTR copia-type [Nitzschia inconspicua]|uniref:Gag-polypeptide of LTR copia-type n=1 Tax=Nitzschia inconspicua TaxID=303405 RepID=A0A9K3P880_9STRA|nr:gag-polypeptide of LTR copia-type [Nitzschia inconspicua]KAG7342691.1 gag-polypeptide of LTR copia-type [Nitzschia inconspicua]
MTEKSIKTIKFQGTKEHFTVWAFQMEEFLEELEILDALNITNTGAAITADEKKMNRKAYRKLALSCDDAVSHQLIKKSISVDFPQGSAKKTWEVLADRWEPKKEVNKQTLTNELFTLKLDDVSKDPEKWIMLLQEKQTKLQVMGETISDGLLMSHILGNLPKEYEHVADNLARDSNRTITSVTDELKEKFERMKIAGTVDDSEKALTGYKKFSGNCNYCGKQGHKSSQCFKKEQAERTRNKKSDKGKTKFQGECYHCGKKGHKKADCFKLKQEEKADESGAVVFMAEDIAEEMDEDISGWTNDPNEEQLICQLIHEPDAELFHEILLIQDRPTLILDSDEPLDEYLYSRKSDSEVNWWADCCESEQSGEISDDDTNEDLPDLISRDVDSDEDDDEDDLTVLRIVKSNGETMTLECNGTTIRFDHRIETANGFLLAARFEPMELQNESAHVSLKEGTNVQITKFHTMMGHANEDSIRLTAKHMGVILTGKMMKCEPCAVGKLKQMPVPKVASRKVTEPGEVMYMDTAFIDKPSMGSKKFWFLFVDGFSDHTISCFGKHKSDLMRVGIDMLLDLKTKDILVKTIRCDNAGENKMLEQACREQGLQIVFEYTAPGTPQQNRVVERKFATLFGKVRSMNNGAGLHDNIRQQLWAEAANCATDLECLLVKKTGDKTPGSPAIFLGYAKQHAGNVYRILDLKTQQLRLSRDVQWLSKTHGEYKKPQIREDAQDDDHDSQLGIEEDETRRLGPLEEYIGCSVIDQHDGSKKLIQPDMIKKIEKEFGDAVSYLKNMKVPMASGINVIRPTEDDPLLSPEDQKDYRSAVGMLSYLVKHSRPDLSNSVRELSKVMDGATDEHVAILHRVIKFVIDTKNRGVLIKPDKNQGVIAYCDNDFAGDMGNRRSITGFLIYLFGVPISWKSKQQGGVTLSSSEAEYYAISEVSMELKFIKMVMDFLDIDPGGPMKVFVDNIGAIHLANNATSGSRTKHIDTRLHFVRELTQGDDKIIDIEFVRSEENQSDTFTKNTSNETFWRLTSKYMVGD